MGTHYGPMMTASGPHGSSCVAKGAQRCLMVGTPWAHFGTTLGIAKGRFEGGACSGQGGPEQESVLGLIWSQDEGPLRGRSGKRHNLGSCLGFDLWVSWMGVNQGHSG